MTRDKVWVLVLWTIVFMLFGMMFLGFALMGDCITGPEGDACFAAQRALPFKIIVGELVAYLLLTWAIFVRRWWK